ncbi:MAG: hypothetical protein LBP26_05670 [Clostridiales bacterium]|nr:hypothetical protein [Clostridiales bacterium]
MQTVASLSAKKEGDFLVGKDERLACKGREKPPEEGLPFVAKKTRL